MTPRLRRLGSTVSVLALAGVGAYGGAHLALSAAAQRLLSEAGGPGVSASRIAVEPLSGRIALHDVTFPVAGGGAGRVERVVMRAAGLVGTAMAAGSFSVDGLKVDAMGASYAIPRIDVTGGMMEAADVRALFDAGAATPLSARLAKISAEQIAIPEIVATAKAGDATSAFTYRDTRLFNVVGGVVRSLAIAGATLESRDGKSMVTRGEIGPMAATAIDLPWLARSYAEAAGPDDKVAKVGYATFSVDGMTMTTSTADGKPDARFKIERISGKDFRIRPSREPWFATIQALAAKPEREIQNLPPAERSRLVNALVDLFEASEIGLVEASGIGFSDGTGAGPQGRIERLAYSGAAVGRPAEMRLEAFEVVDKDMQFRIGSITHTGFSFAQTLAGLRETVGREDFDPDDFDFRKLVPEFGTYAIRDVEMRAPASKGQPTRLGLKLMEISATDPVSGIPTALRFGLDRLTMDIPPSTSEDGLKDLIALGYKDVDLSMGLEARWREADNDLSISNVSVQGVNMGSVTLRGTMGNVTRDVFSGDATMAQIALFGATVKQVALTIDNRGLFERVLEREARRQKKTPDALRKELGAAAQMMVPALLGGTPQAKSVAAAVAKFVAKPGRLVVTAKAKNPMGLGAADVLMNGGNPSDVLAQVELTAVAE